jgi:hypothetical protein
MEVLADSHVITGDMLCIAKRSTQSRTEAKLYDIPKKHSKVKSKSSQNNFIYYLSQRAISNGSMEIFLLEATA